MGTVKKLMRTKRKMDTAETNVHKRDGYSRENTVQKGGQTESAVLCQKETARKKNTVFKKKCVLSIE